MQTFEKQIIDVTIEGVSPLIMNKFNDYSGNTKGKRTTYNDEEMMKSRLYLTDDDKLYQPAEHIEKALQRSGKEFKYAGRKTYTEYVKSGVFVTPDCIPHLITSTAPFYHPEIVNKARVMKAFPILKEWKLSFQLEVINPNITAKDLNEILIHAGRFNGLGDKRPKFGRFIVTSFKYNGSKSSF